MGFKSLGLLNFAINLVLMLSNTLDVIEPNRELSFQANQARASLSFRARASLSFLLM